MQHKLPPRGSVSPGEKSILQCFAYGHRIPRLQAELWLSGNEVG
jgi:hypothetical protein